MATKYKQPVLIMPCGPSGSGKSTLFAKLKQDYPELKQYSFDLFRLEWYSTDYSKAFEASCKDKKFKNKTRAEFDKLIEAKADIYVDNINVTPQSRQNFLQLAKSGGYKTIAYTFNVDLQTLLERQLTRGDKTVPAEAVRRQFKDFQGPQPGEFDEVRTA